MTDEHAGGARDPMVASVDQRVDAIAVDVVGTGAPVIVPGVAIAPRNAEAALKRGARVADRWLVLILTFFLISLGMFLANPVVGIVPVIASLAGVVIQQRKARRYVNAAALCASGANCTLDVDDMLLVDNGQRAMTLSLSPRMSRDLQQQRLPAARASSRKP